MSIETQCKWKLKDSPRCEKDWTHVERDKNGAIWSVLCDEHHEKLESAIGVDAKKMIGYWIAAQGGAKAAADRMTGR